MTVDLRRPIFKPILNTKYMRDNGVILILLSWTIEKTKLTNNKEGEKDNNIQNLGEDKYR